MFRPFFALIFSIIKLHLHEEGVIISIRSGRCSGTNMIIYLDLMFFQNIIADYLILYLIKSDLYPDIPLRRVAMGALLSSIPYIFWYRMNAFSGSGITILSTCFFMSLILLWTFRIRSLSLYGKTMEKTIIYIFLMGGAGLLIREIMKPKVVFDNRWYWGFSGFMVAFTSFYTGRKRRIKRKTQMEEMIYDVEIQRHSGSICCRGIYDSGNLLISQITGRGICVIALEDIRELLDEKEMEILSEWMKDKNFSWDMFMKNMKTGIYSIRYSSVGKENGLMPGVLADHIIVKKENKVLVDFRGMLGISTQRVSENKRFSVILPADIFTA